VDSKLIRVLQHDRVVDAQPERRGYRPGGSYGARNFWWLHPGSTLAQTSASGTP
jgi:hypothetical protein